MYDTTRRRICMSKVLFCNSEAYRTFLRILYWMAFKYISAYKGTSIIMCGMIYLSFHAYVPSYLNNDF
jgi:hypothetical protein